jgi:hypothetical protein
MLILLPFHKGDAAQAAKTLNLCARLEYVEKHQIVLMYPHDTPPSLVDPVKAAARLAFQTVEAYSIPHDIPNTWPHGPNKMFATGTDLVCRKRPFEDKYTGDYHDQNGAFLWMEPDMVPLHKGWLDRLQQQYTLGGKPMLGAVVATIRQQVLERAEPEKREDGYVPLGEPIKFGPKYDDGPHMVGAGMYDRALPRIIHWLATAGGLADPFDHTLKDEICQRDSAGKFTRVVPSDLIAHNWKSTNYRITKSGDITEIECDAHLDNPGTPKFMTSRHGFSGACVTHGCKDDSIYRVVEELNRLNGEARMSNYLENDKPEYREDLAMIYINGVRQDSEVRAPIHSMLVTGKFVNPFKFTDGTPKELTQFMIAGKPYIIPTDQANLQTMMAMEELAKTGKDPMELFTPLEVIEEPIKENILHKAENLQSSPMTDEVHDGDELSPAEARELARLLKKVDGREHKKKNAKKAKSVQKKVKAVKSAAPIRKEIDESAVWDFYTKQPESEAWRNTLKQWKLSPRQLKEIREKNQVTA